MLNLKSRFSPATTVFLVVVLSFFALFLVYPLLYVFRGSVVIDGKFSLAFFKLMFINPIMRECLLNSFKIGIATTVLTTLVGIPLAYIFTRTTFPGQSVLSGFILIPMIMPPFVGAIGMKYFFARFGTINLLLMKTGLISYPIDWLGSGSLWGVVILETLHLFPIMYLNLAAAMANIDPSLEEAAQNLGANPWRQFKTVSFPLMLPGYFAGAIIVFIWAFTDLGTPLIFEYRKVIPVQIFNMVTDIRVNPMGYALVVTVVLLTLALFYISKKYVGARKYEMMGRGHVAERIRSLHGSSVVMVYAVIGLITLVALLPHLSVVLTSVSKKWFLTVIPEQFTLRYYVDVFQHEMTVVSIKNSFLLSIASTLLDITLGITIAYFLTRKDIPAGNVIDSLAMLPLALPGIVLAFGYMAGFSGSFLNPRVNPVPLLIISYAVRRLPYMVRSVYAGLQQTSQTLEEASLNLGASPLYTLRKITTPLVIANIVAGGILAFSFAMLEVSDSLILAMKEKYYPITKAIYSLFGRIADGPYIASAMGILGMVLLATSLFLAGKYLGKRMGELFKVS